MKVLFVADDFKCDPLGIAWLSAYLRAAGHDVGIKILEGKSPEWYDVVYNPPDMLCYSVTTGMHDYYMRINAGIRMTLKNPVISVFGGPHVTFFPEYIRGQYMDIGVRGEGYEAIVDIANALRDKSSLSEIPNAVLDGKINPLRPLMDKTNMLLPDRSIIYKKNHDKPIKSIMTTFGCPHSCPHCFNKEWKNMYDTGAVQVRPVQSVLAEVDDLRKSYRVDILYFEDDVFPVFKRDWLDGFFANYDKSLPFHIHLRVEYITDDTIRRLKEVGLHSVTFAIESGNYTLRSEVLKRDMTDRAILDAAAILHKHEVKFRTQNMIGIPGETWETALQTLTLNVKCNPTIAWASIFQPYPGTELGELCVENGLFDGKLDDISGSFFDTYRLDVPEARRYERLQKLFSLAAKSPLARSLLPTLTRLPLDYSEIHSRIKTTLYKRLYKVA